MNSFTRYAVGFLLAALVALALGAGTLAQAATTTLKVGAGVGSGTTAGDVYTPGEVTVHVGDSISWTINSDEPHSITLGQGPANVPPPVWPVTGFTAPPAGPPKPVNAGTVNYSSGFANTGLIFKGSTATIHFVNAGDYNYFCIIHPGMAGIVHVVAAGQAVTAQSDADAKAALTQSTILGQVAPLEQKTQTAVSSQKQADGTTLWSIFANAKNNVGPVPGGGTGYLELLRYFPADLSIKAGDTVQWTASSPHTVTFMPPGQDPHALGDPLTVKAAKPSSSYDGKSFYNSGLFLFGPQAPSTFTLTFPTAGDFRYLCLLHVDLGQVGTIHVSATSQVTKLPSTGGLPEVLLWAVAGFGAVMLAGGLLVLRSARAK